MEIFKFMADGFGGNVTEIFATSDWVTLDLLGTLDVSLTARCAPAGSATFSTFYFKKIWLSRVSFKENRSIVQYVRDVEDGSGFRFNFVKLVNLHFL